MKTGRTRQIDVNMPMSIIYSKDIGDLNQCAATNVISVTGLDKREEGEVHLQNALKSQDRGGAALVKIPVPKFEEIKSDEYDILYPKVVERPTEFITLNTFELDSLSLEYHLEEDDIIWLHSLNSETVQISEMLLETALDQLERHCINHTMVMSEAEQLLTFLPYHLFKLIYDYWLSKRERLKLRLINKAPGPFADTRYQPIASNALAQHYESANPYIAFRKRTEKIQTRKNQKNHEIYYEKLYFLIKMLNELSIICQLTVEREVLKRNILIDSLQQLETREELNRFLQNQDKSHVFSSLINCHSISNMEFEYPIYIDQSINPLMTSLNEKNSMNNLMELEKNRSKSFLCLISPNNYSIYNHHNENRYQINENQYIDFMQSINRKKLLQECLDEYELTLQEISKCPNKSSNLPPNHHHNIQTANLQKLVNGDYFHNEKKRNFIQNPNGLFPKNVETFNRHFRMLHVTFRIFVGYKLLKCLKFIVSNHFSDSKVIIDLSKLFTYFAQTLPNGEEKFSVEFQRFCLILEMLFNTPNPIHLNELCEDLLPVINSIYTKTWKFSMIIINHLTQDNVGENNKFTFVRLPQIYYHKPIESNELEKSLPENGEKKKKNKLLMFVRTPITINLQPLISRTIRKYVDSLMIVDHRRKQKEMIKMKNFDTTISDNTRMISLPSMNEMRSNNEFRPELNQRRWMDWSSRFDEENEKLKKKKKVKGVKGNNVIENRIDNHFYELPPILKEIKKPITISVTKVLFLRITPTCQSQTEQSTSHQLQLFRLVRVDSNCQQRISRNQRISHKRDEYHSIHQPIDTLFYK
ncbi:hypothetical protein SNEBB_005656 [Seison nebaliae]|nr:hypothetical protein SNEBB_005656 [Seison nebaliae]